MSTFVNRDYSITTPARRMMASRRPSASKAHEHEHDAQAQKLDASPTTSIGRVLIAVAIGLSLAVVVDARGIVHAGLGMQDGPLRAATLGLGRAALNVGDATHLTWPWDRLAAALGREPQPTVPPLLATGPVTATPSIRATQAPSTPTLPPPSATPTVHPRVIVAPSATPPPTIAPPTATPRPLPRKTIPPPEGVHRTSPHPPAATHVTLPRPSATATRPPLPTATRPRTETVRPAHPIARHATPTPTPRPASGWVAQRPLRRLLVTGDSLPGYLGPILINSVDALAPVRGFVDVHDGTGLTRPDFVDWSVVASQQVAADNPDATVVWMGGNDFQNMVLPNGQVLMAGTPGWTREYQRRATICMRIWAGGGTRRVYWLAMPPARNSTWAYDDARIDLALRRAAAEVPGADYLDILGPITNRGRYTDYVYRNGQPVLVREPDGVHVNAAGSAIVANEVLPILVREWRLGKTLARA